MHHRNSTGTPAWPRLCGVAVALLTLSLVTHAAPPAGTQPDPPLIQYSRVSPQPVIEYTLVHSLLAENDPVPLLRVYANGRALVHRPIYMKNAGDFELQLTSTELDTLLQALATDGVMEFDAAAARAERRQLVAREHAGTGILRQISDDTDTLITVRLDTYRSSSAAPIIRNLHRQLRWPNLEQDARRFPASDRLTRASTGARRLHALTEHPALRRIPGN